MPDRRGQLRRREPPLSVTVATATVPLAWATVVSGGEQRRVPCRLFGRPVKVGGKPVGAEVQVLERSADGLRPTDRYTIARLDDLEPMNELAWALVRPRPKVA